MSRTDYIASLINLDATIGATFIGIVLATWVGGIACSEAIRYFRQFPNDNKIFKGVVGVISIINIAHTAMMCSAQYYWTVTAYGDPTGIDDSTVEYPATFVVTGFVCLLVQAAYSYKIFHLSGNKPWLPGFIMLISLTQFIASFWCSVKAAKLGQQSLWEPLFKIAYIWLYGECVGDILITGTLVYYLMAMKQLTTFANTRDVLTYLSVITFETNGASAISCIVSAIFLQVRKDGTGPAVNFLTVKLYCLSLIVTLNARARLGPKNVNTHANSTFALSKVNSSGNSNNNNSKIVTIPKSTGSGHQGITVDTAVYEYHEQDQSSIEKGQLESRERW